MRKRRTQRIEGGGTVMIEDDIYPLVDWSAGGIAIRSDGQHFRVGDRRTLELEIDLDDYAVNLDLAAEVVNRSAERTGWQFLAPTQTQLEVLRALTTASLEGGSFAAPPAAPADRRRKPEVRRHRGVGVRALLAILSLPFNVAPIALAAGMALHTLSDGAMPGRLVTALAPAPPQPIVRSLQAVVAAERIPVVADAAGVVRAWRAFPGDPLIKGEPLAVIVEDRSSGELATAPDETADPAVPAAPDGRADPGDGAGTSSTGAGLVDAPDPTQDLPATADETEPAMMRAVLASPCDCTLVSRTVDVGSRVAAGDTVALLTSAGTLSQVEALFAREDAPAPGDRVTVTFPGTELAYDGTVETVEPVEGAGAGSSPGSRYGSGRAGARETGIGVLVRARVRIDPAVPATMAGDDAVVTVASR